MINYEWDTMDVDLHLAGQLTMIEVPMACKSKAKSQKFEHARQDNLSHALVELCVKFQGLKFTRQGYIRHALIKAMAKLQGLKTTRQGYLLQALVK